MPLETGNFLDDLNPANPEDTDAKSQGAAHLRLIKNLLVSTFPNLTGEVSANQGELNFAATTVWELAEQRVLFPQSAAPTGWTQVTDVNDRVLRVVDGTGGGTGGDWEISGVTVDGHQLTTSEIPSHSHGDGNLSTSSVSNHSHGGVVTGLESDPNGPLSTGTANKLSIGSTNGAGSHSHSISGSTGSAGGDGSHSHGLTADGEWRPSYLDTIIAELDAA